jgi:DNA-3-methyladenine glycosylase I
MTMSEPSPSVAQPHLSAVSVSRESSGNKGAGPSDQLLFSELCRRVLGAGLWGQSLERRWEQLNIAFYGFSIDAVCAIDEPRLAEILETPGALRNLGKLRAVVDNARICRSIAAEHGSVWAWLQQLPSDDITRASVLMALFRRVGPSVSLDFLAFVRKLQSEQDSPCAAEPHIALDEAPRIRPAQRHGLRGTLQPG